MKKSTKALKIGATVEWKWMGRQVRGSVKKIYFKPVTKMNGEKEIKRNGSPGKPAYLVRTLAGAELLKLHTELKRLEK